jgi:TM2 domain-containing membrane protein YozV
MAGEPNPGVAAVCSFFITGLGQIYNGELFKGIILMVIQGVNVALMFVVVGFLTFPLVWIYGVWDAHKVAKEKQAIYNRQPTVIYQQGPAPVEKQE